MRLNAGSNRSVTLQQWFYFTATRIFNNNKKYWDEVVLRCWIKTKIFFLFYSVSPWICCVSRALLRRISLASVGQFPYISVDRTKFFLISKTTFQLQTLKVRTAEKKINRCSLRWLSMGCYLKVCFLCRQPDTFCKSS